MRRAIMTQPERGGGGEGCLVEKLIAFICVVSWSGFWAFGYLALSASAANTTEMTVAALLAAVGFLSGTFAYMALSRRGH